ncbi:calcium-binding protein [Neisseria zalophi]|uniref:Calcium-binding protein n=2 Tax=Neisseria zalophi TaxID=640030 RepID=A0A5J6PW34_9NEIS|nr:calcium-binding protein [Neisseria zalophi]
MIVILPHIKHQKRRLKMANNTNQTPVINGKVIQGTSRNDVLRGTNGNDTLYGLNGNDKLYGLNGNDLLKGGKGNDTLYGGNHNDILYGEDNNDQLYGDSGRDILYGGNGNDTLHGGNDNDILYGDGGNDRLYGENGNDILYGGNGNDTLNGGSGSDVMRGGAGNDAYYVDNARDIVIEAANEGTDTVYSSINYTTPQNVETLILTGSAPISGHGNNSNNNIYGNNNSNQLHGGNGNDFIRGVNGNDRIYGDNGNDWLYGDNGNDLLYGGSGNDLLNGGAGNDRLYGMAGDDTYHFGRGYGNDFIYDIQGHNTLHFNGLNTSDVRIESHNNSWTIHVNGTNDSVTIGYQNAGAHASINNFVFDDGSFSNTQLSNMMGTTKILGASLENSNLVVHNQNLTAEKVAAGDALEISGGLLESGNDGALDSQLNGLFSEPPVTTGSIGAADTVAYATTETVTYVDDNVHNTSII